MKSRLDIEIVRRGLAESRERALRLIMAGRVRLDSRPALKPDIRVDPSAQISLTAGPAEYASRGAYKLIGALDHFKIEVAGRIALDVGASTGGFTDVLLRRGAARVIALDVGYGQLASRLRDDPRVTVLDRVNVRLIRRGDLPYEPDLVVVDVSFISLRLVIPVIVEIAAPQAEIVALVKPQFEVGKGMVGKGGVVRDDAMRAQALEGVVEFTRELGLDHAGTIDSPIAGAAGNREYLIVLRNRA